jgi:hypothetical protein
MPESTELKQGKAASSAPIIVGSSLDADLVVLQATEFSYLADI